MPQQVKRRIPTQLEDFKAPNINTYSIETTIAEKLDAILSLMEFSSRMKDYYDIYYLANRFDFNGNTLSTALSKTFENRNRAFTADQFDQIMTFDADDGMQKKWKAFTKKINTKTVDFKTVLKTINTFISSPYSAAIKKQELAKEWSAADSKWK